MNNIYPILFTIGGTLLMFCIAFLIRWANDATLTGWRLRRWHERSEPVNERVWKTWFAWRPVKTVSGELIWWATVYRQVGNTYSDQEDWTWYYYGTIMDVLKDTK